MFRIDRILANLGYCSRRRVTLFLKKHTVVYHGMRIQSAAEKVSLEGISIDGEPLDHPNGITLVMNKPAGYVCSHAENEGLRVYDLLPSRWLRRRPSLSTIGRLDKETTGVLLITDRLKLNHLLSSPKKKIEKVYHVIVDTPLSDNLYDYFSSGTLLLHGEKKTCHPAKLLIIDKTTAEITLTEGRYHQVKRMFGTFGYKVTHLHRVRYDTYTVDSIPPGMYHILPD